MQVPSNSILSCPSALKHEIVLPKCLQLQFFPVHVPSMLNCSYPSLKAKKKLREYAGAQNWPRRGGHDIRYVSCAMYVMYATYARYSMQAMLCMLGMLCMLCSVR